MHVKVVTNKVDYELDFSGKINVITGNSGSRKTAFLKAINKYKSGVKNVKVKVQQDGMVMPKEKMVLLMNDTVIAGDYHHLFQSMSEGLFIIDETSPLLLEPDIGKVIAESTNYFLFVTRQLIGWLPISIDSIYTFRLKDKSVVNVPKYCMDNLDLVDIKSVDYILTEDSVSGRLFFEHYFPDIAVCPKKFFYNGKVYNRDNTTLHVALEKELETMDNILVVFDASAYGFFYDVFLGVVRRSKKRVGVLSWNSFENYLLGTPVFGCALTKDDVTCYFNSLEQLSTARLKKLRPGYDKAKLPGWVKGNSDFIQWPVSLIKKKENSGMNVF